MDDPEGGIYDDDRQMCVNAPARPPEVWARSGETLGRNVVYMERDGNYVQWLIDGCKAMYEMCDAFCKATKFIYLIDSYFRPDINLIRSDADYGKLYKAHKDTLDAVKKMNNTKLEDAKRRLGKERDSNALNRSKVANWEHYIPLISLLTVKADQGVKVRILIFHPDKVQDKFGGPFGWLQCWGIVRYWSPKEIDFKLAMWGLTKEGAELGAHHQKSAIADTPEGGMVGFCGGIDFAPDRWALPSHDLEKDPIDNKVIVDNTVLGEWDGEKYLGKSKAPNIPLWHDVHAKVVGPAAYDLARNFEQRYKNAKTWMNRETINSRTQKGRGEYYGDEYTIYVGPADRYIGTEDYEKYPADKELKSDIGFESKSELAEMGGYENQSCDSAALSCDEDYSKNEVRAQIIRTYYSADDYSIWDVYKNLFSVAKKNIYIENQYAFEDKYILEILKQTVEKNKKLKVIIVAPLMPDTYDSSINSNLHELIRVSSIDPLRLHPTDHKARVAAFSLQSKFKDRRIPVYVHAKIAVVDDTWAIVGSANLDTLGIRHAVMPNRSSSEIAILVEGKAHALALRSMLVKEHLGYVPNKVDDFDEIYNAFIDAAANNGLPNSYDALKGHLVFHRVYPH